MHNVKMKREQLLSIVKENCAKHVAEYQESVEDYKAAVIKLATMNLKLAKTSSLDEIGKIKNVPQRPVSYEDNYKRAIRMLELSVEDTIDVEEHIFNQLVLDEWGWKQAFTASAALYKSL